MKWVAIKIVTTTSTIVGAVVGFETEEAANAFALAAVIGGLGYEKWIVRELQEPTQ